MKNRALQFVAAATATAAVPSHPQDATAGVGRPACGRAAALGEEDLIVGGRRAPRPQGGGVAGSLLQQALEAGGWRERWAARRCGPSPAS